MAALAFFVSKILSGIHGNYGLSHLPSRNRFFPFSPRDYCGRRKRCKRITSYKDDLHGKKLPQDQLLKRNWGCLPLWSATNLSFFIHTIFKTCVVLRTSCKQGWAASPGVQRVGSEIKSLLVRHKLKLLQRSSLVSFLYFLSKKLPPYFLTEITSRKKTQEWFHEVPSFVVGKTKTDRPCIFW